MHLFRRLLLFASIALATAGVIGYQKYTNSKQDYYALCITQFLQVAAQTWHSDYKTKSRSLPTSYPRKIEDMITFGYISQHMLDHYAAHTTVKYFSPPPNADINFTIATAETPRVIWGFALGGASQKIK